MLPAEKKYFLGWLILIHLQCWEVLLFLDNSAPALYKIRGPSGTGFLYSAGSELSKIAAPPNTGGAFLPSGFFPGPKAHSPFLSKGIAPKIAGGGVQSCWSRLSAEQNWGDFFHLVWRILGNLPANFSAKFDSEFGSRISRPCFSRVSGPPEKFTPKFVGIPLRFHFLEPKIFSRRFSAYGGDQELGDHKRPPKWALTVDQFSKVCKPWSANRELRSEGNSIHQRCFQLWELKCLNRPKEVWCILKSLFSREKEGKYIYTKEPSRRLWGTPSRSIGV